MKNILIILTILLFSCNSKEIHCYKSTSGDKFNANGVEEGTYGHSIKFYKNNNIILIKRDSDVICVPCDSSFFTKEEIKKGELVKYGIKSSITTDTYIYKQ